MLIENDIRNRRSVHGFTLLEVLITLTIVSFGLLAMAGLMLKGAGLNHTSYVRSVAVQQAYDIADRMRANIAGVTGTNYDSIAYTANQTCTACTACTAATMAAYDACYWNTQNESQLPSGRGTVTRTGAEFLITVSWDDNKSGSANKSFALRVQP
ncbi:MAG: type IV pilus modification protein PilV [Sulfuricella sp.]